MNNSLIESVRTIRANWLNADMSQPMFRLVRCALMGLQPQWALADKDAHWFKELSDEDAEEALVEFTYFTYDDDEDPVSLAFFLVVYDGLTLFLKRHKIKRGKKTKKALKDLRTGLYISRNFCEEPKALQDAFYAWETVLQPDYRAFHPMHCRL